jgi:hypothetical protein
VSTYFDASSVYIRVFFDGVLEFFKPIVFKLISTIDFESSLLKIFTLLKIEAFDTTLQNWVENPCKKEKSKNNLLFKKKKTNKWEKIHNKGNSKFLTIVTWNWKMLIPMVKI